MLIRAIRMFPAAILAITLVALGVALAGETEDGDAFGEDAEGEFEIAGLTSPMLAQQDEPEHEPDPQEEPQTEEDEADTIEVPPGAAQTIFNYPLSGAAVGAICRVAQLASTSRTASALTPSSKTLS